MKILAIDPATRCGFAHSCGISGTWDLSVKRDESGGMRLFRLRGKLQEILDTVGIDVLVYEAARNCAPSMQGALVIQATLQGVIQLWCEDHGVEYRGYSPSEVKKRATGKGNASKEMMVAMARSKWPEKTILSDDQADALWILDLAKSELTPSPAERAVT
jgi:Holliday junction resolvasome RuvABC endonuclease subunit